MAVYKYSISMDLAYSSIVSGLYMATAGIGKITSDAWVGENAGAAVKGFMGGAIALAEEGDVAGWYAWFLENFVIPNAVTFSYMVAWGEVLIGLGLRSEEHTSELQSRGQLVCRLLLEKNNKHTFCR